MKTNVKWSPHNKERIITRSWKVMLYRRFSYLFRCICSLLPSSVCLCDPSVVLFYGRFSGKKDPMCETIVRKWLSDEDGSGKETRRETNKLIPSIIILSRLKVDLVFCHFGWELLSYKQKVQFRICWHICVLIAHLLLLHSLRLSKGPPLSPLVMLSVLSPLATKS